MNEDLEAVSLSITTHGSQNIWIKSEKSKTIMLKSSSVFLKTSIGFNLCYTKEETEIQSNIPD